MILTGDFELTRLLKCCYISGVMIEGNFLPHNFLGLDEEDCTLENSKVVILPVPYERTVSFGRGTSKGPHSIIYASRSLELYDDELHSEPYEVGIHTLPELECDVDPKEMVGEVQGVCAKLLENNQFIITLGGEHSITLGAVKAHKGKHGEFSVLNIDAHCDLRDSYEGTKYNHACVMRRVLDEGCPVVECGIRSYSKEEADFIRERGDVKIIHAREISESGKNDWMDEAVSSLLPDVYISVDVDSFDPSVMPSTGTPEPGGLSWYDVLGLLRETFKQRNVIGMDIVELAPVPGILAPDVLAAKLAYKSIGYKYQKSI